MNLTVSASGPASPDEVWDRYIHPARWPEWSPQIQSVDYPDNSLRAGGSGTVHGPCGLSVDFDILSVDVEKLCWSWRVKVLGVTLTLAHDVRVRNAAGGTGTRTTLDISGPAPVVVGYAPIARLAMSKLVR